MPEPAQLPFDFSASASSAGEAITETLPPFDHGYFDALAATGFAALADAYFDTPETPLIQHTAAGFTVTYRNKQRDRPQRHWLRYTIPASWAGSLDEGTTKKAAGWDGETVINTDGASVDTSDESTTSITVGNRVYEIRKPARQLYGVINKLGKPDWVNLCVYACRHRGLELLQGTFEESSVTFNSIVLPQSSKGGNASNAFSIGNSSLSKSVSRSVSRLTCLALAGLLYSATGQIPDGFALPVPRHMRLESLRVIVNDNRLRLISGGFFFPYDNYLNYLKLLLRHEIEPHALNSVAGANFIELGAAPSPAGAWQFAVPEHRYTESSAERLQMLLYRWKQAATPKAGSPPSINREAVRLLVGGFEHSDPAAAAEGYLGYIADAGLISERPFYPLTQTFFIEIMEHDPTYAELLQRFQEREVQEFVRLVRKETYNSIFPKKNREAKGVPPIQPNYQMIRKLRDVQDYQDLLQALTELTIERSTTLLALAKSENAQSKMLANFLNTPTQQSITRIMELAARYEKPRMIAHLVLAFALSHSPWEPYKEDDDDTVQDVDETE